TQAQAADDKPAAPKPHHYLTEAGPQREFRFKNTGTLIRVKALREVFPGGKAAYFLQLGGEGIMMKLATEAVSALVKLDKQLAGEKKAEAEAVAEAVVMWSCPNQADGKEAQFWYSLGSGWGYAYASCDEKFIPALEQALKDVEALKAVKPSVS